MHVVTRRERGQSMLEYAICLAVVVAALLAMQIYVKRGISGKLRAAADSTGEQYEPRKTTGQSVTTAFTDTTDVVVPVTEAFLGSVMALPVERRCIDIDQNGRCGDDCDFPVDFCDLNRDGTCAGPTSDRLFASITVRCLNQSDASRVSLETVQPLGTTVWN